MEMVCRLRNFFSSNQKVSNMDSSINDNTLAKAQVNKEYIIKSIETNNHEMEDFLFTLGCYEGEKITVISVLADNYVISVKDARYSIDKNLAECILV
jgi:ferrous iron transport protein A